MKQHHTQTKHKQRIAIVGNPNCGKTTLFNALTGSRQKVGNWAGVTVEKKVGQFTLHQSKITVTDLPGIYSLSTAGSRAIDERIACQYLLDNPIDLVINIVDASNLKRHLYLTRQLLEMQVPCILALNMMDTAEKQHIKIDCQRLAAELGCPVIPMVSRKGQGIEALKNSLWQQIQQPATAMASMPWPSDIEPLIASLQQQLQTSSGSLADGRHRWLAIRLLEKDSLADAIIKDNAKSDKVNTAHSTHHDHSLENQASQTRTNTEDKPLIDTVAQHIQQLETQHQEDCDIVLADYRYQWIEQLLGLCCRQSSPQQPFSQKLDHLIMHPVLGIPIFLVVMYLMFEFSMSVGTLLQPLFDISSTTIFVDGVNYLGYILHVPLWLTAILANGIGLGINTVLSFIPQIGLLFLALCFLEDCGYMARAAFVMDRVMQAVGLPGKSFIPLIIGFGCNVPGIMATRTLDSQRDRIITAMMSPFMSCGARLAIFVVFGSTFFPQHAGFMIFVLYLIGIAVALLTGVILKYTLLRGQSAPFILEIPQYHLPTLKNLMMNTWQRLRGFVVRAGRLIIPICVLVGSLNTIQTNGTINPQGSQHSLLAVVGRQVTPVFSPMGISQQNWPATVGLITGTLAKEVVVGTLNTLYTQNQSNTTDPSQFNLTAGLLLAWHSTLDGFKQLFSAQMLNPFTANIADAQMTRSAIGNMATAFNSSWAAISYLLFVLLYIPCVSTIGVIAREIGRGWSWAATLWSTSIAYTVAVICFQISQWIVHPFSASVWMLSLLLLQAATLFGLHYFATHYYEKSHVIPEPR